MIVPNPSTASSFFMADGILSEPELLFLAAATAAIETPLFWLCGYRRRAEWLWFVVVNLISNLLLNGFLIEMPETFSYLEDVLLGEIFVVLLEFALCGYAVRDKRSARLFRVLLLTNAASFFAGVVYFML